MPELGPMRVILPWSESVKIEDCRRFSLDVRLGVQLEYSPYLGVNTVWVESKDYTLEGRSLILTTATVTMKSVRPPVNTRESELWEKFMEYDSDSHPKE